MAKTIANLMTKWSWGLEMLSAKRREFGNIVGHVEGISDASSLGAWTAEQFDLTLDWKKIEKLMEMWGGKVILKGILDADDAVPLGNEPVYFGGAAIGKTTSAGFGYRVGKPIALADVSEPDARRDGAAVEIDIAGERFAGRVVAGPAYDPAGTRMRRH